MDHPYTEADSRATVRVVSGLKDDIRAGTKGSHRLPVVNLDPKVYSVAQDCVQCGLCLPSCPTYVTTGDEADSPRGRIHLMKSLADGRIEATQAVVEHLDLCLDCRGCETVCPSGVVYHELIEQVRSELEKTRRRSLRERLLRWMVLNVFPYPRRLRLAILPGIILKRLKIWDRLIDRYGDAFLPESLTKIIRMLPDRFPPSGSDLGTRDPGRCVDAETSEPVGVFTGCIGSVLGGEINERAIWLLRHAGCEVWVPRGQRCCGAIHHHNGDLARAKQLARANINAFLDRRTPGSGLVVNQIAGCGAMLKEYPKLLADDPRYAGSAKVFAGRVCDISEALIKHPPDPPPPPPPPDPPDPPSSSSLPTRPTTQKMTYHDPCHLAHAQRITVAPREVLRWVNGIELSPLAESDMCCGAAGTYNLAQPGMSRQLAERKIRNILRTGANTCVTGNIGCQMHIQSEAERLGIDLEVKHFVSVLFESYQHP